MPLGVTLSGLWCLGTPSVPLRRRCGCRRRERGSARHWMDGEHKGALQAVVHICRWLDIDAPRHVIFKYTGQAAYRIPQYGF